MMRTTSHDVAHINFFKAIPLPHEQAPSPHPAVNEYMPPVMAHVATSIPWHLSGVTCHPESLVLGREC
jgi:hypothetical protein